GRIQIDGNRSLNTDQLAAVTKVRPGDYYDQRQIETDLSTIRDIYGYRGYGVTAREHHTEMAEGQVLVHYEVTERPPARVGQIYVVGNEVTRQNVILRQLQVYPGQILSYPDLRLSERNLARLQIFENNPETGVRPTVTVLDPDSDNPFKDLLVTVQEQPTGSL